MSDTYSQGYALFNPAATNAGANTWQSERDRTELLARRARQLRNVRHKEDAPTTSSRARLPDLSGGVYACAGLSRVFRLSRGLLMWDVSRRRLHFGNGWRAGAGRRSAL